MREITQMKLLSACKEALRHLQHDAEGDSQARRNVIQQITAAIQEAEEAFKKTED